MTPLGFLLLTSLSSVAAITQDATGAPVFTHDTVTCMTTEAFPIIEASVPANAPGTILKSQVYFKASSTKDWYFVDMDPIEATSFRAFLPKPLAETDRVDYYLFFLTDGFGTSQSESVSSQVSSTGCGVPVTAASPVSLTLRATVPSQLPVPPGFQPQGISGLVTTAGNTVTVGAAGGGAAGGISGTTVGIVAGAGAAATGAAIVAGTDSGEADSASQDSRPDPFATSSAGSGSAPPPPAPSPMPPTPAPTPTPSAPDVSGLWFTTDRIVESCTPSLLGRVSDTLSTIEQNGTRLTLSRSHEGYSENHTGTIDTAGNISLSGQFVDDGDSGTVRIDATTTDGSDMAGTRTHFYPEHNCTIRATFTGSKR